MNRKENRNIYIVEDMGVTRAALISVLQHDGFNIVGFSTKAEKAWLEIKELNVAVVLIDVNLEGTKDGIWLAQNIKQSLNCAIIFLTAYGSNAILERIQKTEPDAYIMKPFNNPTLLYAVATACQNLHKKNNETTTKSDLPLMIKSRIGKVKVYKSDLIYLQSDGNYVNLFTTSENHSIRGKLDEVISFLDYKNIYRIHRRYAVNFTQVASYNAKNIVVSNGEELPFSKSFDFEVLIKKIQAEI